MKTNGTGGGRLVELVDRITAGLDGVRGLASGTVTEYRRGQHLFAAVDGRRASLRLRPDIAEAALRTPATAASSRGPEWIEFEVDPENSLDVDRLQVWLTIGWRSAQRQN